jgi:hypothetical protein
MRGAPGKKLGGDPIPLAAGESDALDSACANPIPVCSHDNS